MQRQYDHIRGGITEQGIDATHHICVSHDENTATANLLVRKSLQTTIEFHAYNYR